MDTDRTRRLCAFIDECWLRNWVSPTVHEMGNFLGVSKGTMHVHLSTLVREGVLEVRRLSSHRVLYRVKR